MGRLDRSPRANWVEKRGGLPDYIDRIAVHIHEKGAPISVAIATAINAAKKMCATGDLNWPGLQNVNTGSRAEACAAVAQWEAMKTHSVKTSNDRSDAVADLALAGAFNSAAHPRAAAGGPTGGQFTAGQARNDGGKSAEAQKNTKAASLYDQLMKMDPAQRAAFLKGLSDGDLQALSRYAYSFNSSDKGVVSGRIAVANSLARRGMNVNDYGGLGKPSGKPAGPAPKLARKARGKGAGRAKGSAKAAKAAPARPRNAGTGTSTANAMSNTADNALALASPAVSSGDGPDITVNANLKQPSSPAGCATAIRRKVAAYAKVPAASQATYRARVITSARKCGCMSLIPEAWQSAGGNP